MHFVCDKCNAKYSIPDEKISGKILKLRCKRCSNTIVVKDPKAVASMRQRGEQQPVSAESPKGQKGRALLQNAFKKSLADPGSQQDQSAFQEPLSASSGDKTQIAQLPGFDTQEPEEEWYLADRRGQFGPMDLKELIARIKRGEPQDDAVVWRDGFDDWMALHLVPELKPYRRHAPPPRKSAQLPEVAAQPQIIEPPVMYNPSTSQMNVVNPMGTAQFKVDHTGQYHIPYGAMGQAGQSQAMGMQALDNPYVVAHVPPAKNRLAFVAFGILGTVVLAVAIYFAYSLGKTKASSSSDKPLVSSNATGAMGGPATQPGNSTMGATMGEPNTPPTPTNMSPTETVYTFNPPADEKNTAMGASGPSSKNTMTAGTVKEMGTPEIVPPAVGGTSRSTSALRATINEKNYGIRRCYAITVRKGQSALVSAQVTASIKISANGKASSVFFSGSLPPMMKTCLSRFFQSIAFPKGSRTDKISYRMHFNPT
ncbi:zinc-ribbon domain-containing protein [Myxococcota bacterium]|nr:zinc-ribbon domain-containing protein [Myxococcota bacterium]